MLSYKFQLKNADNFFSQISDFRIFSLCYHVIRRSFAEVIRELFLQMYNNYFFN
jgi:hypothetical protein